MFGQGVQDFQKLLLRLVELAFDEQFLPLLEIGGGGPVLLNNGHVFLIELLPGRDGRGRGQDGSSDQNDGRNKARFLHD